MVKKITLSAPQQVMLEQMVLQDQTTMESIPTR
jgi:hypothetical protein